MPHRPKRWCGPGQVDLHLTSFAVEDDGQIVSCRCTLWSSASAPRETIPADCAGNESLHLKIDPLAFGGKARGHVDGPGGVATTKTLRDQSSVEVEIGPESTTAPSARRKSWGRSLPRFPARRRIPAQAFGLKKYRCGRSPVSKISDNEHTASPLGNGSGKAACSDVLSVQHSVGPPIPEFAQAPEEGTKVPSFARRQDAGHVLPNHPLGPVAVNQSQIDEGQVAARIVQSLSKPGDAEGLAGGSAQCRRRS